MIHLTHGDLTLDLLDPASDQVLQGTRYCWGGYIWQVNDARCGPLLRGPQWPNPAPDPFNGQGLPESFRVRTLEGRPLTWNGSEGVMIGGGTVRANAYGKIEMVEPCRWEITRQANRLTFRTGQQAFGYAYELVRKIELEGRTLTSSTLLTNHATTPLQLEWFPHPFYALSDRLIRVDLPPGCTMGENPGFSLEGTTLRLKQAFHGELDGHMDHLRTPATGGIKVRLSHPQLEAMEFETSYIPSECPIWANGLTFSIEPYLASALPPGQSLRWSLRHGFGHPKGKSATAP
ncbi:MAG: hypothetical protein JNN01_26510 [Opitutaceae bacterium]|nr:hypothetical protein [Opitutaceae bacterium]